MSADMIGLSGPEFVVALGITAMLFGGKKIRTLYAGFALIFLAWLARAALTK